TIDTLKNDLNSKSEETFDISKQLTDAKQEIVNFKSKIETLESQILSLKDSLNSERQQNENNVKEKDAKILELTNDISSINKEKDDKIHKLEDKLSLTEKELDSKLKEFSNSQTTILQLRTEIDSNKETFNKQKESY